MRKDNLTRKYIFESFYSLLNKQKYESITICDICKRAGISRMSFYRNFDSKEDLLIKSMGELTLYIKKSINNLEIVNQYYIIKEFFIIFDKFKNAIASFENSRDYNYLLIILNEQLEKNFQNDFISKTSKYIPLFYLSALGTTILAWLKCGAIETPDEMSRLVCSLINSNKFEFNNNLTQLFPSSSNNNDNNSSKNTDKNNND